MKSRLILIFSFVLLLTACRKTPDGVIKEKDMAMLLADMHEADAIVELDATQYKTDSIKKLLKQSIFIKHGITQEQFDSSLVWYGKNLDVYTDVYDKTVEILENRKSDVQKEAQKAGEKLLAAGDSVDIWPMPHTLLFNNRLSEKTAQLTFSIPSDTETKMGDKYIWKLYIINNTNSSANLLIGVDYSDGSSEIQTKNAMSETPIELTLQSDSTKTVNRVFGYLQCPINAGKTIFIDKSTLSRTRINREQYFKHTSRQRKI